MALSGKPGRNKCCLAGPCVLCVAVWPHYDPVHQAGSWLASVRQAEPGSRMRCFSTGQEELCSSAHPLHRPQEIPRVGKECGEGSGMSSPHTSLLKLWDVGCIGGTLASGSPDTGSLWPLASQPSALPQRGRKEGTMACTHSVALSRTL